MLDHGELAPIGRAHNCLCWALKWSVDHLITMWFSSFPVPAGELGLEQKSPKSKLKEDDSGDTPQLLFSPTIKYIASQESLCPDLVFRDRVSKRTYTAKIALQVEVHPGSYKIGPPSVSTSTTSADPHFKLDETEWLTKERGNTSITALLVYVNTSSSWRSFSFLLYFTSRIISDPIAKLIK